ncbi:A24 family peptidase [Longirhabdus pacifica]|uniref:A24 family peptidase n=1 Tax=Longirhabdus pacifica TaxID=2305227 RepID=UPI00100898F9|nr:A24 family peptidase [Longirhabdus pacifica]
MVWIYSVLSLFVVVALITDMWKMIIPNVLTVSMVIVGLILNVMLFGLEQLIPSLIGALVSFVVMFVLYMIGAVAAGDVKFFAGVGALVGMQFSLYSILYSVIYAGIIGIFILLFKNKVKRYVHQFFNHMIQLVTLKKVAFHFDHEETTSFPFMVAVAPAIYTVMFL